MKFKFNLEFIAVGNKIITMLVKSLTKTQNYGLQQHL